MLFGEFWLNRKSCTHNWDVDYRKAANFSPLLGTHGHALNNEGSLACQSCSDTGHPFMWSSPRTFTHTCGTLHVQQMEHFFYITTTVYCLNPLGQSPFWVRTVWCHLYIWYHTDRPQNGLSPCAWIYGEHTPLMVIVNSGSVRMPLRALSRFKFPQEQASWGNSQ